MAKAGRPPRPEKELPPIGRLLREIRGTLTFAEAGGKLGHDAYWWHRRETGKNAVTVDDLQVIAKVFGVAFIVHKRGVILGPN